LNARTTVIIASVMLMLGVGTGAFGAHGLRAHVAPDMLSVWQTAVLYQVFHALGLLGVAALRPRLRTKLASAASLFILAGILIFSGSLYALVLSGVRVIGAITPVGGVSFMIGWVIMAIAAARGNWSD